MTHLRPLALLLALLCLPVGPALAQPGPGGDPPAEEQSEELRARLRLMQMYALTEALELDEETAAKLFPYLREGDQAMAEVHDEMRGHRKALRALANEEGLTDAAIDEHITAMGKLEQRMSELRAEQVAGLKGILTPEQRLRFVLTRAKIERELRRALRQRKLEERRGRRGDERRRGGELDRGF